MDFKYVYFGELIESEIELNLAPASSSKPRFLKIRIDQGLLLCGTGAFSLGDVPAYEINAGNINIQASCYAGALNLDSAALRLNIAQGISSRVLTQLLVEEVFPLVSFMKGELHLHASAVAAGSNGYCFLGSSGAGKSTLAANLMKQGLKIIDDDRALLRSSADGLKVWGNRHPLRLFREETEPLAESKFRSLGVGQDGKQSLMPPGDLFQDCADCSGLIRLKIDEDTSLVSAPISGSLIEVLEEIPLSWLFSRHFADQFMVLLERLFSRISFVKLGRDRNSDPRLVAGAVLKYLEEMRCAASRGTQRTQEDFHAE